MKKIGFFGFLTYPEVKILQKQTFRLKICPVARRRKTHHPPGRYQKSQKINIFHSKVSCKLSPLKKLKSLILMFSNDSLIYSINAKNQMKMRKICENRTDKIYEKARYYKKIAI